MRSGTEGGNRPLRLVVTLHLKYFQINKNILLSLTRENDVFTPHTHTHAHAHTHVKLQHHQCKYSWFLSFPSCFEELCLLWRWSSESQFPLSLTHAHTHTHTHTHRGLILDLIVGLQLITLKGGREEGRRVEGRRDEARGGVGGM